MSYEMKAGFQVFPVLPGKEKQLRAFCKALNETRRKEFDASETRLGVPKESFFLHKTSMGSMLLVYYECADPLKSLQIASGSQNAFDKWFKEQMKAITGIDINDPVTETPPQPIMSYGY